MASAEVEETIRRLSSHKGVEGIVISTYEGVALRSTLSAELTTRYAGLMTQLVLRARGAVRTIDAEVRGCSLWGGARGRWAAARSACSLAEGPLLSLHPCATLLLAMHSAPRAE